VPRPAVGSGSAILVRASLRAFRYDHAGSRILLAQLRYRFMPRRFPRGVLNRYHDEITMFSRSSMDVSLLMTSIRRQELPLGVFRADSHASTVFFETPITVAKADCESLRSARRFLTTVSSHLGGGFISRVEVFSFSFPSLWLLFLQALS
jgi:hypothetical protein